MSIRVSASAERLRGSLFFVPMLFVVAGVAVGFAAIGLDGELDDGATDLPFVLTSTVDSARAVLGVIASATITVAGIAFSVVLLVIQQASSQFSPRVVHSLFRDPFNRRVVGVAVGTFTYCLIVLRSVRGPLEEGGEAAVPNLSVAVAVVLGIIAMLAVIAFIDHNAHTMEVSEILSRVSNDTVAQVERWQEREELDERDEVPPGPGHCITFEKSGWLQQVSTDVLLHLVPARGTIRLDITPGRYAVRGTPMCTLWPAPEDRDDARTRAQRAVQVGPARTMQEDASYGIRQLADVALIALSPGVNDPTTAQDAIFHLASVLREALVRDLPPRVVRDEEGRRLIRAEDPDHGDLVDLAFGEIRRTGAAMPRVAVYLFEALHLLQQAVEEAGVSDRVEVVRDQAALVLAEAERSDVLPGDLHEVRAAYERRFGA